jgi:putative transcriptional regulator
MIESKRPAVRFQYHAETDMLSMVLVETPYQSDGAEDTHDPDIVLHYRADGRLAEIEIEHASTKVDLGAMRKSPVFEDSRSDLDVRSIREKLGLTQADFADSLGVSVGSVQNWERGKRTPRGPARRLIELSRDRPGVVLERFEG